MDGLPLAGIPACHPALTPAILVALIFRTAEAFAASAHLHPHRRRLRTATETLAFLNYQAILNDMRFGYGSALSVIFLGSLAFALFYLYTLGLQVKKEPRP
jgi:ABC-type sugar transport system permease subunit